jgi:hypothetical protein
LLVAICCVSPPARPQSSSAVASLKTGKEIFEAGCAGCHGHNGKGAPQTMIGFDKPSTFPDFTLCNQTTPEPDVAWKSVIHDGGPSRGFVPIMPSFAETLTSGQIDEVVGYLRGFCKERGWPRGDLNFPRALGTEKAFPENEEVIVTTLNAHGAPGVSTEYIHEQRIGAKNQIEVSVPIDFLRPSPGVWYGGFGDIGLGLKRVLFSNLNTGSIASMFGEVIAPTGNVAHGLGSGVTTFQTFGAYDQLFPFRTFVQLQGGAELPVDTTKAPRTVFMRGAVGRMFNQSAGLGRLWSPMFEVLADRDLETGARTFIDVMPEFQVTLSKRQHVRFNVGLRIPATNTQGRNMQVMFYLLWDWQDGRLLDGWK